MRYWITTRDGHVITDERGRIIEDHCGRDYIREPADDSWKIIGIAKRWHSVSLVSLAEAAAGEDIGHGFVHDEDHGTHRVWAHPATRRAVKVTRII